MTDEEYRNYLNSAKWRGKALARLRKDNFTCRGCGTRGGLSNFLEIHHLSYDRVGDEDVDWDLVTCCKYCHTIIHNILERPTSDGRFGWHDSRKVPRIHVFTVNGTDRYYKLQKFEEDEAHENESS